MDSAQALYNFWSGFTWKAYDENTVPSEGFVPEMPRITYGVATTEFGDAITLPASLWDRSYSWEKISQKADEIYNYIGLGGRIVQYDTGALWIKRGMPFAQRMSDEDDSVRRIYLSIEVEYFTAK